MKNAIIYCTLLFLCHTKALCNISILPCIDDVRSVRILYKPMVPPSIYIDIRKDFSICSLSNNTSTPIHLKNIDIPIDTLWVLSNNTQHLIENLVDSIFVTDSMSIYNEKTLNLIVDDIGDTIYIVENSDYGANGKPSIEIEIQFRNNEVKNYLIPLNSFYRIINRNSDYMFSYTKPFSRFMQLIDLLLNYMVGEEKLYELNQYRESIKNNPDFVVYDYIYPLFCKEPFHYSADINSKVYDVVEKMPMFPDGRAALQNYLKDKTVKFAQDNKRGTVVVSFIIETDGKLTSAKVIESNNSFLDCVALSIVDDMPNWIPGKQNDKEVRVRYYLKINF